MKKSSRLISVFLAAFLLFSLIPSGTVGGIRALAEASQSAIDDLEGQRDEIHKKQEELESQIGSLEYEQMSTIAKKEVLDEKVFNTQLEITNLSDQISEYDELIAIKELEIKDLEAAEADRFSKYKARIRIMEEGGDVTYYEIIFGASSFSDLLSRVDFISEMMASDELIYNNLIKARKETIAAKEDLQKTQAELKAKKDEHEKLRDDLEAQIAESARLLEEIMSNIAEREQFLKDYEDQDAKLQKEIEEMQAELERKRKEEEEAKQQQTVVVVSIGDLVWPSSASSLVTSLFGNRFHPILHYWRSHSGIDISAYYGTNVLAAASGTVITAAYNEGGYGYFIMIAHDNGLTTLYGHMSRLLVSDGQRVEQGQTIGLVGSTGLSTGPHIHFEVYSGGERVDPLGYFDPNTYTVIW